MNFTPQGLADEWAKRAARVRPEGILAVERIGGQMLKLSRRNMYREIYLKPETRSPRTGKPRWVRTQNLLLRERLVFAADGSGVTLTNDAPYARRRHDLDYSKLKSKKPPLDRTAHWRKGIFQELHSAAISELLNMRYKILRGGK